MPTPRPTLSVQDVRGFVAEQCFPERTDGQVGVELEWLVLDQAGNRAGLAQIADAVAGCALRGRSTLTFEPGAQLELSSAPDHGWDRTCQAVTVDLLEVTTALAGAGLRLLGAGSDPDHRPVRLVDSPRYRAMEAFFDNGGEDVRGAGRAMMCNSAAIQINLEVGDAGRRQQRWELAHALGPVLVAAFANSPLQQGRVSGWRSSRWAAWRAIDPTRTRPALSGRGCVDDWADFALAARVMLMRVGDRAFSAPNGLSFARWIRDGHELGWPDAEDLRYHLTTLFPPVRPKGWLELRMVDALPDPWWRSAVAVATTLLDDPEAADGARKVTGATAGRWEDAARLGLSDPSLAAAARTCFELAIGALERTGSDPTASATAEEYAERYVWRGRCPADDVLDTMVAT